MVVFKYDEDRVKRIFIYLSVCIHSSGINIENMNSDYGVELTRMRTSQNERVRHKVNERMHLKKKTS